MSNQTKKLLCLAIVLALLLCSAACKTADSRPPDTSAQYDEKAAVTAESEPAAAETAVSPTETPEAEPTAVPAEQTTSFAETTVVSIPECTVTLKSFDPDGDWGPTFTALLENNMDKALTFVVGGATVNGIMCNPFFYEEVAAGKKANTAIDWYDSNLEACGILYPEQIVLNFRIYDPNDWSLDPVFDDNVVIDLQNTSDGPSTQDVVYEHGYEEQVLVQTDTITVIVKDFDPDSDYGPALTLYCENNTDQNLSFSMDDVSVNGFMCDPYWAEYRFPHAKSYSTATWYTDDLTENGITQFENVEFKLRVYDADDWSSNDLLSETYTLTF